MGWSSASNKRAVKFFLFLAIFAGCWYLGRIFDVDVATYQNLLSNYPVAISGCIFVLLYVGTTTLVWFGPKDILRIASAVFFGAFVSTVFVWLGEMINAVIMFHLSRILGREYVQQKLGYESEKIDQIKEDASLLGVIAWRINPLIPFRLMDLGYGLTKISFRKYFIAIIAVTFIRILWLQYILAGIGISIFEDFWSMFNYFSENPAVSQVSAYYFLAVIVLTLFAVYRKKKG